MPRPMQAPNTGPDTMWSAVPRVPQTSLRRPEAQRLAAQA